MRILPVLLLLAACADGPQRTYRPQPAPELWRAHTVAVAALVDATQKVIDQHQCAKRYRDELGPALEAKLREAGYRVAADADVTFAVRFVPALRSDDQLLLEVRRGGSEVAHFRIVEPQVCKALDRLLTKLVDDASGSRHAALNLGASSAPVETSDVATAAARLAAAIGKGDAHEVASFYADDAVRGGSNGATARGKKQIEEAYAKLFLTPDAKTDAKTWSPEVRMLADDVAITRGVFGAIGYTLQVWKKTGGRWLIVEDVSAAR